MVGVAKACQKLPMNDMPLEFLSGSEVIPRKGWNMPMHSHPMHELIVVLDGRMRLETESQDIAAERGDLLFYHARMAHRETSDDTDPVNTFFISFKGSSSVLRDLPLQLRDTDARVRQMISWLVRDHRSGVNPGQQNSLLEAVVNEMSRLCAAPVNPWLADLREHMQQHLAQSIYLADLADKVGMSKFAFVRKFKRLSGRTPMKELQLIRLNQARTMLLTSGLPVKAIAPEVGLGDEYQLAKLFRRHFRLSPTELRTRSRFDRHAVRK